MNLWDLASCWLVLECELKVTFQIRHHHSLSKHKNHLLHSCTAQKLGAHLLDYFLAGRSHFLESCRHCEVSNQHRPLSMTEHAVSHVTPIKPHVVFTLIFQNDLFKFSFFQSEKKVALTYNSTTLHCILIFVFLPT